MSPLLRLERHYANKKILKSHFEFAYFSLFLFYLDLKRQIRSYTPAVPSKAIPDSRPKWAKSLSVFRLKRHKNNPFGVEQTYMAYVREQPPPGCYHNRGQLTTYNETLMLSINFDNQKGEN